MIDFFFVVVFLNLCVDNILWIANMCIDCNFFVSSSLINLCKFFFCVCSILMTCIFVHSSFPFILKHLTIQWTVRWWWRWWPSSDGKTCKIMYLAVWKLIEWPSTDKKGASKQIKIKPKKKRCVHCICVLLLLLLLRRRRRCVVRCFVRIFMRIK